LSRGCSALHAAHVRGGPAERAGGEEGSGRGEDTEEEGEEEERGWQLAACCAAAEGDWLSHDTVAL
jgi:hypothetical protein